jgi:hypothetical protein
VQVWEKRRGRRGVGEEVGVERWRREAEVIVVSVERNGMLG